MNLEDQIVSLKLAKELKILGVKQGSLFYWYDDLSGYKWGICYTKGKIITDHFYSAYTATELLEMLPSYIDIDRYFCLLIKKYDNFYYCEYSNHMANSEGAKLADCLAKMLIYLIEDSLIKVLDLTVLINCDQCEKGELKSES